MRSSLERYVHEDAVWPLVVTIAVACAVDTAALSLKRVWILEWRPTDLAAIALNYYRHGFDFLHPAVLWGGNGPGYVEMEYPLVPFTIAVLYRVFGVHDFVALSIPILCGIGESLVIYLMTRRSFGTLAALVAGLVAATSPTAIDMSTGLWPDVPPIFLGSLGVYLLMRWVDDDRFGWLIGSAACISLAILLKITYLFLGVPLLFLFVRKYGRAVLTAWQAWMFAAITLVPSAWWYAHAYHLFVEYGNTFGIIGGGYLKFGTAALLTSPVFYVRTVARVIVFHVTPLGALLALAGLTRRIERPLEYVFPIWVGASVVYMLVAAQGVNLGHYQYALPIVPPLAVCAGSGFVRVWRWLESTRPAPARAAMLGAVAIGLVVADSAAANGLYRWRGTAFRKRSLEKMATGRSVGALTRPGSLIVVVDADMDGRSPDRSMTPPEVFYFADRRGWYRAMAWLTPGSIGDLRRAGAEYLAVSANDVDRFRGQYAALYHDCSQRYRTLMDGRDGIVYDLTRQAADDVR